MAKQTFPGYYPQIIDDSFLTSVTSRFRPGLIGVAQKGPFDQAVAVSSIKDFRAKFGVTIPNTFLSTSAAILSALSDGLTVVRVGNQYTSVASDGNNYFVIAATKLTGVGTTASLDTTVAHNLVIGDTITVAGVTNDTAYNGTFLVATTPTSSTLTYTTSATIVSAIATGAVMSYSTPYKIFTASASLFAVNDYIRVRKSGFKSTVNAKVSIITPGIALTIVSTGGEAVALSAIYAGGASIGHSLSTHAANEAEAALQIPSYVYPNGTTIAGTPLLTDVIGDKSAFTFTVTPLAITTITRVSTTATVTVPAAAHNLSTGDKVNIFGAVDSGANPNVYNGEFTVTVTGLNTFTYILPSIPAGSATGTINYLPLGVGYIIKITQASKNTTREIRLKTINAPDPISGRSTIVMDNFNKTDEGYQALPLQDSYALVLGVGGAIEKRTGFLNNGISTASPVQIFASTAGTWANSDGVSTGLMVRVSPGSSPDTKKLLIYQDSGLVEVIDNLSNDPTSTNYFETRINGASQFITITILNNAEPPSNTIDPWGLGLTKVNLASALKGYNGENASASDYVGTIDPNLQVATGLKLFDDPDNFTVNVISAPGVTSPSTQFANNEDLTVFQEIDRICGVLNAVGIIDSPPGLNASQATDWHNAAGLYSNRIRLDTRYLALYWNWITVTDPFTGASVLAPPSLGAMRALAATFDREKPWFAAAGETRGLIPEARAVQFTKVSDDQKQAMYGDGNSVNPILLNRNRIMVFGERTLQRAESKLTALHSVILVNHIVNGLGEIGRQFIFDPNDEILLQQIRLQFSSFLDSVRNERGLEEYRLVVDETNNTAATRNLREVIVDLFIIPTDTMERLFLNATVRASGASLNSVA